MVNNSNQLIFINKAKLKFFQEVNLKLLVILQNLSLNQGLILNFPINFTKEKVSVFVLIVMMYLI